jgi:hypothetical protein
LTEFTFKFKQSNGNDIELSIEDAKQLYQNLHKVFGTASIPNYPTYPVQPNAPLIPNYPSPPLIPSWPIYC